MHKGKMSEMKQFSMWRKPFSIRYDCDRARENYFLILKDISNTRDEPVKICFMGNMEGDTKIVLQWKIMI